MAMARRLHPRAGTDPCAPGRLTRPAHPCRPREAPRPTRGAMTATRERNETPAWKRSDTPPAARHASATPANGANPSDRLIHPARPCPSVDPGLGCGVGRRAVGGRQTNEWAVVVYVSRKLPRDLLRASDLLPSQLDTDGESVGTDVVEAAPQHLLTVDSTAYRPLRGGCQIANSSGAMGTLGGIVYDSTDYEAVMLTCNHVLTLPGSRAALPPDPRVRRAGS
ncbi:MAG: hypothetical protein ACXVHQ_40185 [Solirubrobacteraceae bacterium]